jgi:uncharacterized membrane protein
MKPDALLKRIEDRRKTLSINVVFSAVLVLYPVLVFLAMVVFHLPIRYLSIIVILFAATYIFINARNFHGKNRALIFLCPIILFLLGITCLLVDAPILLNVYPAIADLVYLLIFGVSFFAPPPIVYQFASTLDKSINKRMPKPALDKWCVNMTVIWCVFFVIDGIIALITVHIGKAAFDSGSRARIRTAEIIWGVYNGGISYAAMGVIFISQLINYKIICDRAKKTREGEIC